MAYTDFDEMMSRALDKALEDRGVDLSLYAEAVTYAIDITDDMSHEQATELRRLVLLSFDQSRP